MKIGIIIIFRNNESSIKVENLAKHMQSADFVKFCLVDNNSKDNTIQLLNEIKENCTDKVEIVEIKKMVSEPMAKRAGARYLFSNYNLKYIGFINLASLQKTDKSLDEILEHIVKNKEFMAELKTKIDKNNPKPNFFKGIISIVDSEKKINKYRALKPSL
ncbi:glycosyltransferase family A protein [Winogradskyella sp.]|uniref:glycosyltransferase family A protein n=1 Tax=Winogradskyella sp. TaxID=1883156 RepID=UPI003514F435